MNAELVLVISNNSGSSILSYARSRGIEARHLSGTTHPDDHSLDRAIVSALQELDVDVVFLSGYMKKLGPETITHFRNRILNVHPSLLPEFGGKGMYGDRVYEAVLDAGKDETGATIHIVDEEYDHGPIVLNRHVPVKPDDDVERLRNRVRQCERQLCLEAAAKLGRGELPPVTAGVLVRSGDH